MSQTQFKFGDRLIHPAKPEWGQGVVTAAQNVVEEGEPCQRLTLRFERAGLKTLSTRFAPLQPADLAPAAGDAQDAEPDSTGWLDSLSGPALVERMARLPEATTDPFASLKSRLQATVELYRFSDRNGSLLDWAAMQTGLADPLSHFSRQELEQFFQAFDIARARQLKQLTAEALKADPEGLRQVIRSAPAQARNVMQRHDSRR